MIRAPSHSHFVLEAFRHSNSPFGLVFVLKRRPSVRPPASLWDVKPPKKMPVFQTFLMSRPLLKFFLPFSNFLGPDLDVSSKNTSFTAKQNFKNRVQIARISHFFELLFFFLLSSFLFSLFFPSLHLRQHYFSHWPIISNLLTSGWRSMLNPRSR